LSEMTPEPSTWTSPPSRGAPFAGYMLLGLLVGLLVATQIPYGPLAFLLLIAYLVLGSRWNHALWNSRWKNRADLGTTPETAAFWTTVMLLLVGAVAASQGDDILPWATFYAQVAVAAVIIPVTLRRYPGIVAG
jgi:ABC-type transport system involved in cytochrome c biogenesis permease subunit